MIVSFIHRLIASGMLRRMHRRLLLLVLSVLLLSGLLWFALVPAGRSPPAAFDGGNRDEPPVLLPQRDHERVRAAVARGEMVPLEGILADAQRRYPGRVLEVELERDAYEIEIIGDDGVIMEFEYDSRTGELLEYEVDD